MSQFPDATTRLGLVEAPGALAVVQRLVNTRPIGGYVPDLLDGAPGEQRLRALRDEVLGVLRGAAQPRQAASATVTVSADGSVALEAATLADEVWLAIALAQRDGGWARLKLCRNEGCASAFYDRSRNNSGVWHDVRSCGNAANLRAYRTRRKQASPGGRGA